MGKKSYPSHPDALSARRMPVYAGDRQLQVKLRHSVRYLLAAAALIVVAALLGWSLDIPVLRRPIPWIVAMNPLTAVLFLLSCAAFLSGLSAKSKFHTVVALLCAVFIFAGSILPLADVFFHTHFRADQWLFASRLANDLLDGTPNRMAPNAAVGFFFLSMAIMASLSGREKFRVVTQWALVPVFTIALLGLIGYLYRVPRFYGVLNYKPLALHTAVCFFLMGLALLFSMPDRGIMRHFTTVYAGSRIARRMVAAVLVVPVLLGFLRLLAEWNLHFPVEFGVALLVLSIVASLLLFVWYTTYRLNEEDAEKQGALKKLGDLNEELESRVMHETQRALQTQTRLQQVLDNMLEGVQIINREWVYLYANEAVARQAQLPISALLGKSVLQIYPGVEKTDLFRVLSTAMYDQKAQQLESPFQHAEGRIGWYEMSIQPIPEGIFILTVDITERKNAENEIKKTNEQLEKRVEERTRQLEELNDELKSFSYSVSHDLRSPLRIIKGYADMLLHLNQGSLSAENEGLITVINNSVDKMDQLIEAMLMLAHFGAQTLQPVLVDTADLVQEIVNELKSTYPHAEKIRVENLGEIWADRLLLRQVFANLLENAVKYSAHTTDPQIIVRSEVQEQELIFHISDNGVGFDMKYADKLFGVFQRLHKAEDFPGNGVGLATVQRIVHKHGGRVWAESAPGQGSTFSFSLPRH